MPTSNRSKPIRVLTRTKSSCSDERQPISYSLPDFQQIWRTFFTSLHFSPSASSQQLFCSAARRRRHNFAINKPILSGFGHNWKPPMELFWQTSSDVYVFDTTQIRRIFQDALGFMTDMYRSIWFSDSYFNCIVFLIELWKRIWFCTPIYSGHFWKQPIELFEHTSPIFNFFET